MTSPEMLIWPILLMLAGCAIAATEIFVPSGGILGFLSALSIVAAIVMAFVHHGQTTGLAFTLFAVVAVPVSLAVALKYWPNTRMGKRFLLGLPTDEEVIPESFHEFKGLIGKTGRAKTTMLPAGAVEIDGRTIDAITQGMPVESGELVKVIEVRANRVVVRPLDPNEQAANRDPSDVLSQPLETLGLDDEPLG